MSLAEDREMLMRGVGTLDQATSEALQLKTTLESAANEVMAVALNFEQQDLVQAQAQIASAQEKVDEATQAMLQAKGDIDAYIARIS